VGGEGAAGFISTNKEKGHARGRSRPPVEGKSEKNGREFQVEREEGPREVKDVPTRESPEKSLKK